MYFNTFLTINTRMRNSSFDNNWPVQAIQFQLPQSSSGGRDIARTSEPYLVMSVLSPLIVMSFTTFVTCAENTYSSLLLSWVSIQVLSMLSSEVNLKQNSFYKHFSENFNSFHYFFDIYFYKLLNYGSSRDSFVIYNGTTHTIGMFSEWLWIQNSCRCSYLG